MKLYKFLFLFGVGITGLIASVLKSHVLSKSLEVTIETSSPGERSGENGEEIGPQKPE